jgi:hypothetical protein
MLQKFYVFAKNFVVAKIFAKNYEIFAQIFPKTKNFREILLFSRKFSFLHKFSRKMYEIFAEIFAKTKYFAKINEIFAKIFAKTKLVSQKFLLILPWGLK